MSFYSHGWHQHTGQRRAAAFIIYQVEMSQQNKANNFGWHLLEIDMAGFSPHMFSSIILKFHSGYILKNAIINVVFTTVFPHWAGSTSTLFLSLRNLGFGFTSSPQWLLALGFIFFRIRRAIKQSVESDYGRLGLDWQVKQHRTPRCLALASEETSERCQTQTGMRSLLATSSCTTNIELCLLWFYSVFTLSHYYCIIIYQLIISI